MKKIKAIGFDPELQEPVDLNWDGGFYCYETKMENIYGDKSIVLRFTPSFQENFHHFFCKTSRFYKDEDIYSDSYCKLLGKCYSFEKAREFIKSFSEEAYIVKVDYCEYYCFYDVDFSKLDFSDLEDIVVFREDFREVSLKEEDLEKDNFYKLGIELGFIKKNEAEDNLLSINIATMVELYSNQDVAHYVNELNSIIFGKDLDLNKFSKFIQEKQLDSIDASIVVSKKDYANYDLFSRVYQTFNFFYELSTFYV